jgi:hypothetical protein
LKFRIDDKFPPFRTLIVAIVPPPVVTFPRFVAVAIGARSFTKIPEETLVCPESIFF